MIKVNKNYIYIAIVLVFSLLLFSQGNITVFRPVYVRASELELFSIEFWALITFIIFIITSFIRHKGYLFEKFIIGFFASLLLTDSVYKLASVQISDIFGFMAIFTYYSRNFLISNKLKIRMDFLKKPPGIFMLVTFLACFISLISPGYSYFYDRIGNEAGLVNITSWLYLARIAILFLLCNILYNTSLNNKKLVKSCIKILLYSGVLGCIVYWTQIGLFTFNLYDVNGIFNDFGFPRAKGIAHEPATFAHSLFFLIVLSLISYKKMNFKILSLIITTIATFSLGTYITTGLCILVYNLIKLAKKPTPVKRLAFMTVFLGVLVAFLYYMAEDTSIKMAYKVVYHVQNKLFEQNPVIDTLFQQYPSVKVFGVGLLNSVQPFADSYEVRNSYSLILQDTGLLGFLSFILLLFYNLFMCFKNSNNDRKVLLSSYIISFCLITLSVIRLTFFPYLWLGLTLFYDKSLFKE